MKIILQILCGLLLLTACSAKEEPIPVKDISEAYNTDIIEALERYNSELIISQNTCVSRRGFGHWCAVATADILGAYRLAQVGGELGALLGPTGAGVGTGLGALIGGVGGSYGAHNLLTSGGKTSYSIYMNTLWQYGEIKDMEIIEDESLHIKYEAVGKEIITPAVFHNVIMKRLESFNDSIKENLAIQRLSIKERAIVCDSHYEKSTLTKEEKTFFIHRLRWVHTVANIGLKRYFATDSGCRGMGRFTLLIYKIPKIDVIGYKLLKIWHVLSTSIFHLYVAKNIRIVDYQKLMIVLRQN